MNKKLLTVAIGAALSAAPMLAAQADVKVGGHAHVDLYSAKATCSVGSPTTGAGNFAGSGTCTAANADSAKGSGMIDNARGRIWVTADEDLGAGLKGLAHIEFSVDVANSAQSVANGNSAGPYDSSVRAFDARTREKYVGLAGGFGSIKLGNQHGVYKRMGGVRWDPFNATPLEARGNGGQSGSADANAVFAHNGFIPGAIKWESGKLLGEMVLLEVLYSPKKNSNGAGDAGTGNDYQIGVSVKPIKGLEVIAAHSNNKKTPNILANNDQKANKLGARFNFLDAHTVFLQYETVDMLDSAVVTTAIPVPASAGIAGPAVDGKYLLLGYSLKLGNSTLALQAGKHDRSVTGGDLETDYLAGGLIYNFSKTMRTHVGYRQTEATQLAVTNEQKVFTVGMRKDF